MEPVSISELLQKSLGNGVYQTRQLFILTFSQFTYCLYIQSLGYLVSYDPAASSFTNTFAFIDEDDYKKNKTSRSFYCGLFIGALALAYLSSRYGRMAVLKKTSICQLFFFFLIAITIVDSCAFITSFLIGLLTINGVSNSILLIAEVSENKKRAQDLLISMTSWGFALIFQSALFINIIDWRINASLCAAFSLVENLMLRWVLESPRILSVNGKNQEAQQVIENISKINGAARSGVESEVGNARVLEGKGIFKRFFSERLKVMMFILAWGGAGVASSKIVMVGWPDNEDMYRNGIGIGAIMVLAAVSLLLGLRRFLRKRILVSSIVISRIVLAVFISVNDESEDSSMAKETAIGLLFFFVAAESLILCISTIEAYFTPVRVFALGIFVLAMKSGDFLRKLVFYFSPASEPVFVLLASIGSIAASVLIRDFQNLSLDSSDTESNTKELLLVNNPDF